VVFAGGISNSFDKFLHGKILDASTIEIDCSSPIIRFAAFEPGGLPAGIQETIGVPMRLSAAFSLSDASSNHHHHHHHHHRRPSNITDTLTVQVDPRPLIRSETPETSDNTTAKSGRKWTSNKALFT
jgi:hypothetical protein